MPEPSQDYVLEDFRADGAGEGVPTSEGSGQKQNGKDQPFGPCADYQDAQPSEFKATESCVLDGSSCELVLSAVDVEPAHRLELILVTSKS